MPLPTAWLARLFSSVRCFFIKNSNANGCRFLVLQGLTFSLKGTSVFHSLPFFNWKGFISYFQDHHRAQKENSQFNHSNHRFWFVFFSLKGHPSSYILSPLLSPPSRINKPPLSPPSHPCSPCAVLALLFHEVQNSNEDS